MWKDGIFFSGNTYSKTYRFEDINYQIAGSDNQRTLFLDYSALLNSFESDAFFQITINNHRRNPIEFERDVLFRECGDDNDMYRREYNQVLSEHAGEGNGIVQEKYITITTQQKDVQAARNHFTRVITELTKKLDKLGSSASGLDAEERLKLLHNFYRNGEETHFDYSFRDDVRLGRDFRDYICPDSMEINKDYLQIGKKVCRTLFFKRFSTYIDDAMIKEICDTDRNMMLTLTVQPLAMEKAIALANNKLLGTETNIANWQRNQNKHQNFSAIVPYDKELARKECREFLDDLRSRDQRVFFVTITIVHAADSLEELNEDTESICTIARNSSCQIAPLRFQQLDGLNTTLPFGLRQIEADSTMTTESLAAFIPFNTQEINHPNGIYYGQNVVSGNMILVNRLLLQNGNSFILGLSGSGKSMMGKTEILSLLLGSDADVIVIDPDREYNRLTQEFGGEVIQISEISDSHINALDIRRAHDETIQKMLKRKQSYVLSLCEEIIGADSIDSKARSMIDRCTGNIYQKYIQDEFQGTPPTLKDLYEELKKQPEALGKELALEIELYAKGSLNTFAQQTNVDTQNRLICYDIHELGNDLMTVGMLVVLDNIMNRIAQNREDGKKTFIFIDEIYLLFQHQYSSAFLYRLWKRIRKYGGSCTGLTQNVEDVLQSQQARALIANSEFLVMLNQSSTDRPVLAKLLNIPDSQLSYITGAKPGHGLLKVGSALIPFANDFPKDTMLYRLMTTNQDEVFEQKQMQANTKKETNPKLTPMQAIECLRPDSAASDVEKKAAYEVIYDFLTQTEEKAS